MTDSSSDDNAKTRFRVLPQAVRASEAGATLFRQKPAVVSVSTTDTSGNSTGSGWGDPALWQDAGGPTLAVGSVINSRFVLEEAIGTGGMGTVFKARDLRKVEAQDRNPYVAIKVLNEDFRQHPLSLQALQRESRKTQKLAHPNIVTVYDFDRDGTNVFMVMELLEGEPLDRLIKRHEGVGAGVKEALRITQEICRAMAYAHSQGIVHSDFKPANTFLTRESAVKVLDFGIARAAKHNEAVSGVKTLFDPGSLGALTPAYAGCEVIEGAEADSRDDVYAIACVAYELITGRHPFNHLSAAQAREAALAPTQPRGLSGRQWRTLRRGLALSREQRPKTATEFFEGLRPLRHKPAVYVAVACAAIAIFALAVPLISGQIDKYRDRSLARVLASADPEKIEPLLPQLREFEPGRRASVFLDDAARTGFVKYYESRMNALVDARLGHYNYPGAEALLGELEDFLPDSQAVQDLRDRLTARKTAELKREAAAFNTDLEHGWLLPGQNADNIQSLLQVVAQVDPRSELLHDSRLPQVFAAQATEALQHGQLPVAASLVSAGLTFDPANATLLQLRDQAKGTPVPDPQPPPSATPALRDQITAALAQPTISLPQARSLAESVEALTRHGDPDGPALAQQLSTGLAQAALGIQTKQGLDAAIRFVEGVYALFPESRDLRDTLVRLRLAATQRASQKRDTSIAASQKQLESLLKKPRADDAWSSSVDKELQRLGTFLPASDPYLIEAKTRAGAVCVSQAVALRNQQRLPEARHMLELSAKYAPDSAELVQEERQLADAERAEKVKTLKQQLLDHAQANEMDQAQAALTELRSLLPANDPFLTREAPAALAPGYLHLATSVAQEGRFAVAVELVNRARALAPALDQVTAARTRFNRYQALDQYLTSRERLDSRSVRNELVGFGRQDQAEAAAAAQGLLRNLVVRINSTHDPQLADRLLQAAKDIFGEDSVTRVPVHPAAPASK
jgi:serine/threonine protein kinase